MNKVHFLTELKIHLKPLPPQQVAYILQVYTEKFDDLLATGESEVIVSQKIGNPQQIATEILKEYGFQETVNHPNADEWEEFTSTKNDQPYPYYQGYNSYYERPPAPASFFIRFCQVAGIFAFNFFLMIWMILAALLLIGGFWIVVLVLLGAPLLGIFVMVTGVGSYALFQLFVSLILAGLGLIGLAIMIPVSRYTGRFLKHYTKCTLKILRGR